MSESLVERINECLELVEACSYAGAINGWNTNRYKNTLSYLLEKIASGKKLRPIDRQKLSDIETVCTSENIEEAKLWTKEYDKGLREVAVLCAEYYESFSKYSDTKSSYFYWQRRRVLDDPEGHTLTKSEFNSMCQNKYAIKLLEEQSTEPKFKKGQLVLVRATNRLDLSPILAEGNQKRSLRNRNYVIHRDAARGNKVGAMILKVDPMPTYRQPSKGCRVYKIVPFGETIPLFACEKDLKVYKK